MWIDSLQNSLEKIKTENEDPCVCINKELNLCFRKNEYNECLKTKTVTECINSSSTCSPLTKVLFSNTNTNVEK